MKARWIAVMALVLCASSAQASGDANETEQFVDAVETVLGILTPHPGHMGERQPEPIGASIMACVQDWAGRPIDGRIHLVGDNGQRYDKSTTAGRVTFQGVRRGTYRVSVDPAVGTAPPPATLPVPRDSGILRILLTSREPAARTSDTGHARSRRYDRGFARAAAALAAPSSPNLASGERLVAQYRVFDYEGRPIDAMIYIFQSGREIGHAASTAGSGSIFDLERGEYEFVAKAQIGGERSGRFTITAGIQRFFFSIDVP